MVNAELGVGIVAFAVLGFLIHSAVAAYHFLDYYFPEQLDGFEVVGVTFKEAFFELALAIKSRLHRLWVRACAFVYVSLANLSPSLVAAYETVYHSERSNFIADIIADSWKTIDPLSFPDRL